MGACNAERAGGSRWKGTAGAVMGAVHLVHCMRRVASQLSEALRGRSRWPCWRAGCARQRVVEERHTAADSVGGHAVRRRGALAPGKSPLARHCQHRVQGDDLPPAALAASPGPPPPGGHFKLGAHRRGRG